MNDQKNRSGHCLRARNVSSSRCGGFTLIEVIIVLFFMVAAAAVIVPRYSDFQRASQARDVARNVASLVREAREIAIEQNRPLVLEQIPEAHAFALRYDDSLIPPDPYMSEGTANPDAESPIPPVFYPDAIMAEIQPLGDSADGALTFTPEGRATDGDIIVAYGPERGLRVSVRRQATRVRIGSAEDPPEGTGELF